MLAKKTPKNQVTLPKAVVQALPDTDYFDVSVVEGAVVLKPVVVTISGERMRTVRAQVKALGVTAQDIRDAIRWARRRNG